MRLNVAAFLSLMSVSVASASPAPPAGATIDAKAAFEKLKGLNGHWTGTAGGNAADVNYRVTGGGSAVVEEQFPGTAHEMVTVYHLDGDALVATHYCAAGNQPKFRLSSGSTPTELRFEFDGGSNIKPESDMHMHSAVVRLPDATHLESAWTAWTGGKANHTAEFKLTRKP